MISSLDSKLGTVISFPVASRLSKLDDGSFMTEIFDPTREPPKDIITQHRVTRVNLVDMDRQIKPQNTNIIGNRGFESEKKLRIVHPNALPTPAAANKNP